MAGVALGSHSGRWKGELDEEWPALLLVTQLVWMWLPGKSEPICDPKHGRDWCLWRGNSLEGLFGISP